MQKHIGCLVVLFLVLVSPSLRAETLDDATINKIYAEAKVAIHDSDKTRALMKERLDDGFTMKSEIFRAIGSGTPEKSEQTKTKTEAIRDQVSALAQMNMENYDSKVTAIQYSGDRKEALVSDESSSFGTIDSMGADGRYVPVRYAAHEICTDTLALVESTVKIMQSQCSDEVALDK